MLYRKLAGFSVRHYPWVIAGWLLIAAVSFRFALQLPHVLGDHGLVTQGSYGQVREVLSGEFRLPDEPVYVLFDNRYGKPERAFRAEIARFLNQAERISGVNVTASPLDRREMARGRYAYAQLSVPGSISDKRRAIGEIRDILPAQAGSLGVYLTGKPVVQEDVNLSSKRDVMAAEKIGFPAAFALLAAALGGLFPAVIPLLAGAMSVMIAMGIMYGIGMSGLMPLSVFVYHVIPMAGMAVSIDFALLTVSRFREEKAKLPVHEALLATMKTAGRAVVLSLMCVIPAILAMFFIRMPIFQSVGLGSLVVLAVSGLINLTFVPALLYAFRRRIRGSFRPVGRLRLAFMSLVMKRPAASAAIAAAVLAACLSPALGMQVGVPGPESLPADQPSRAAAELLRKHFQPQGISQVYLVVSRDHDAASKGGPTADYIRRDLERDPLVAHAETAKARTEEGHDLVAVWLYGNEDSEEVRQWVRERERFYDPAFVRIGGEAKYRQEVTDEVSARIGYVLGTVLTANFIVLIAAFRSILIPLKAVLMNLISIGASFGILTWVFQTGQFGLEPTEIAIMIPVWIFGLIFGISMDYGIFLLSRIYESYRELGDNDRAIREGLAASGIVISSAAAIMIAVTAPFALAGVSGVKQLGVGIAAALFLDATLVRLVLVPSLMKMLGKWNWWMPFANR